MIIVGELINASRKSVKSAIKSEDRAAIQKLAGDQAEAGADYIDVNAGVFIKEEIGYLKWLVENVLEAAKAACCIDSANPKAIDAALEFHREKTDQTPMITSISLESRRWETLLPIISGSSNESEIDIRMHKYVCYRVLCCRDKKANSYKKISHRCYNT